MRSARTRVSLPLLFPKFWLFLNYLIDSAIGQCETGLEATCVWHHSVNTAVQWRQKTGSGEVPYVELTDCDWPQGCGIGLIESPWMGAREGESRARLFYKIYGTSKVFLRLQLRLEDDPSSPRLLLSKTGNYAYLYPEEWSSQDVTIPPTHTNHQLLIKAFVPYREAMVAVKGITLDRNLILTSTQSSTISSTTAQSVTLVPTSSSTSTTTASSTTTSTTTGSSGSTSTTTTTTVSPGDNDVGDGDYDDDERTRNDLDYFPDDDDDDEIERRFQALEVQNFIGEEDLTKGFTTVVKPQLCMYR